MRSQQTPCQSDVSYLQLRGCFIWHYNSMGILECLALGNPVHFSSLKFQVTQVMVLRFVQEPSFLLEPLRP